MNNTNDLLSLVLREPELTINFQLCEWDLLVRQARKADLLSRLRYLLNDRGLLSNIPSAPARHLESAHVFALAHERGVLWEIECIRRALSNSGEPIILLKGAAYVMAKLPAGQGRIFHDIDFMVPKEKLDSVEQALLYQGWRSMHVDAYDQQYYRQWMHELPPLIHYKRQSVLDVHHNILPETARLHPDPRKLIAAANRLEDKNDLKVLAPVDMVLHSATHLFHDGELENGLRDLVDLDSLLRHFSEADDGFWEKLIRRAMDMDLIRPFFYTLRYTEHILGTPIPEFVKDKAQQTEPNGGLVWLMDHLFLRGLKPDHPSCRDCFTGIAQGILYIRSHYLRMPFHLLIPHLFHKTFITPYKERRRAKKTNDSP